MQSIVLDPSLPIVGSELRIELKTAANADVEFFFHPKDNGAQLVVLGKTDSAGVLLWTPPKAARGEIRAMVAGVEYVIPIEVMEGHGFSTFVLPWGLAAVCVLALSFYLRKRKIKTG